MRKPIIGGNWKMNRGSPAEAKKMLDKLIPLVKDITKVDIVICAPYTALASIYESVKDTNIKVGAQNMYFEEKGAYTGEICASQIKELGLQYVIIGHSERRKILQETDEMIHKKLNLAFGADLIPILCIGETYEERKKGKKMM